MSSSSHLSTRELIDKLVAKLNKKTYTSVDELDAVETRIQKLLAIARGKRNGLQPIHRLPPNILENIFLKTQPTYPSFLPTPRSGHQYEANYLEWLSLLHVCRHWRGVIASSKQLWSIVDNAYAPEKFLRRSGELLLTVFFGIRKPLLHASQVHVLTAHIHRIRELHIGFPKDIDLDGIRAIFNALSQPAHQLQSLTISTHGLITTDTHLPPLFKDQMPVLRKLCLEYYTYWPLSYFGNLTHLCLHHQADLARVSTNEFLDFLEASPYLEELILVRAGPMRQRDDDGPAPAFGRRVRLARLRSFSWGEIEDMAGVRRLLSYLSLPQATHLYFWGSAHANGGDLSAFIPADLTYLPCMLDITEWKLRCSSYPSAVGAGVYLLAFVDGVLYTLDIAWESYIARLPAAFALILQTVENFYVLDSINVSNEFWKDAFRGLPHLTTLMIQPPQQWGSSRAILGALYPEDAGEGSLRLGLKHMFGMTAAVCPRLRTLLIEADPGFQGFYMSAFAKARMKRGSPLQYVEVKHLRQITPSSASAAQGSAAWFATLSPATGTASQSAWAFPVAAPDSRERLEAEDRHVLEKSVKKVRYLYDQEPTVFEPPAWPTRGYVWTTMPFPYQDELS